MRCELESPLVPSLTAARLGLWPYGLAFTALPLVSRPWTGLCLSHLMSLSSVSVRSWCYRASWLAQGSVPLLRPFALLLAYCCRVPSGSLLRFSRQVFSMGSPFWVEPVSVLDRNEDSSSTFLVFGWSLRDGVTLSGRVVSDLDRNEDSLRTFPCGWRQAFAMGSPVSGRVALFCALDQNKGFFRSSILRCFVMGSPCRSCVFFSHSIVTKSTLDN